jgi:hypothetical protein
VRRIATAVLAATALSAATAEAAGTSGSARLAAARSAWAAQRAVDYSYVIRRSCFCPAEARGPVTVNVTAGKPRGTPPMFRDVDTMGELFAEIRNQLNGDGVVRATYRKKLGAPKTLWFDPIPIAADDEVGYTITHLLITARRP